MVWLMHHKEHQTGNLHLLLRERRTGHEGTHCLKQCAERSAHLGRVLAHGPRDAKGVMVALVWLEEHLQHRCSRWSVAPWSAMLSICTEVIFVTSKKASTPISLPPTFQNSVHFSEGHVTGPTGPSFNLSVLQSSHRVQYTCAPNEPWQCNLTDTDRGWALHLSPVKSSRVTLVFRPASYAHLVRSEWPEFSAVVRVVLRRGIALAGLRHLLCREAP